MGNCDSKDADTREDQSAPDVTLNENMLREQKNRDVFKYYEVTKVLGEGSMGAISKIRKRDAKRGGSAYRPKPGNVFEKITANILGRKSGAPLVASEHSRDYALKTIQINRITDEFLDELRNEIDILKRLDHPNIVKAYEVFEKERQIFIVMEICAGGDLYTRVPYSEKEAAKIVGKILSAISYMHSKNVVHRDLKFENIMFENNDDDAEIKIIDFGLSTKYMPGSYMTEGVGTIYTMAPQVLQGVYTSQADLWSVGVIAYMLLSSSKPFYHKKRRYLIDKIMRCSYNFHGVAWKDISSEGKQFVASLIKLDPKERLTADEALNHPWLDKEFPLSDRGPPEGFMDEIKDNIISYRDSSEFKKMALMVIAHKSSTDEIVKLRQAFDQFDSSNDGTITLAEFKEALGKHDYSEEDIKSLFSTVDVDKSGKILYTEFLAATLEVHGRIEEERLAEAFDRIDSDDTGYISRKNLREMLGTNYTPEKVDKLLEEADFNNNGQIDFDEFLKIVHRDNETVFKKVMEDESSVGNNSELLTLSSVIPGGKQRK